MMDSPHIRAQLQEEKDKKTLDHLAGLAQKRIDDHPALGAHTYTEVSYNDEKDKLLPTVFVDMTSLTPTHRIEQIEDLVKDVMEKHTETHVRIHSTGTGNDLTANPPSKK